MKYVVSYLVVESSKNVDSRTLFPALDLSESYVGNTDRRYFWFHL